MRRGDAAVVNRKYFPAGEDAASWHVYSVDWTPTELIFRVDGELAYRVTRTMVEHYGNFVFVLGELRKGQTVGSEYWGIAVGLRFVLNGKVHYGEGFSAGEFQSILWKDANHGQFSISDEDSRRITSDPGILSKVIDELSAHIAFLVNTLNLTCVVIGGRSQSTGSRS